MRSVLLLLAFVAAAAAYAEVTPIVANKDFLKLQKAVWKLVQDPLQEIPDEKLRTMGKTFDIGKYIDKYDDPVAVKYMINSLKYGRVQPKGRPFTPFSPELRKDWYVILRAFLAAINTDIFLKTACWVRTNMNEEQFITAFAVAVFARQDMKGIILPPLYEILPNYFFNGRLIQKAQNIRSMGYNVEAGKSIVIPTNYTAFQEHDAGILDYFTHDPTLGSWYTYFTLIGMMDNHKFTNISRDTDFDTDYVVSRGAQFIDTSAFIYARWRMEVQSNYPESYNQFYKTHVHKPSKSNLRYVNGLEIPGRTTDDCKLIANKKITKRLYKYVDRIYEAIDMGYAMSNKGHMVPLYTGAKGYDTLGNMIEGYARSPNLRLFGSPLTLFGQKLGGSYPTGDVFDPRPSVLENPITMLRDLAWYTDALGWVSKTAMDYQNALPPYTWDDLVLRGVKIESVKFSKLETFYEKVFANLGAAMYKIPNTTVAPETKTVYERLNHKSFTFEIDVTSDKPIKNAVVRMFIGPKYDDLGKLLDISENRNLFYQLDQFSVDLNEGQTIVKRNSHESPIFGADTFSTEDLYRHVKLALNSETPFHAVHSSKVFKFPGHLMIPKGQCDGYDVQIVSVITDGTVRKFSNVAVVPKILQPFSNYNNYDPIEHEVVNSEELYTGVQSTYGLDDSVESGERYLGVKSIKQRRQRNARESTVLGTNYWDQYYKGKHVYNFAGIGVSLDGNSHNYPLNRPIGRGALLVPNIKLTYETISHKGELKPYSKYGKTCSCESRKGHVVE